MVFTFDSFEAPQNTVMARLDRATQQGRVSVPKDWRPTEPRLAIAADVKVNDRYLGQIAEAVIDVESRPGDPRMNRGARAL